MKKWKEYKTTVKRRPFNKNSDQVKKGLVWEAAKNQWNSEGTRKIRSSANMWKRFSGLMRPKFRFLNFGTKHYACWKSSITHHPENTIPAGRHARTDANVCVLTLLSPYEIYIIYFMYYAKSWKLEVYSPNKENIVNDQYMFINHIWEVMH